jgi:hypothetical protein
MNKEMVKFRNMLTPPLALLPDYAINYVSLGSINQHFGKIQIAFSQGNYPDGTPSEERVGLYLNDLVWDVDPVLGQAKDGTYYLKNLPLLSLLKYGDIFDHRVLFIKDIGGFHKQLEKWGKLANNPQPKFRVYSPFDKRLESNDILDLLNQNGIPYVVSDDYIKVLTW